jgi:NADH dehydrogenase
VTPRTVLVTGATGFLGRRIAAALRDRGHEVIALVRRRTAVERAGTLDGCRLREGDVLDPASLHGAADGVDTVIHLVGIIRERGAQTFDAVVADGTAAVVAEARRARARRFLYLSALGADPRGETAYFRTKGRAEEMTATSGLEWLVLRASLVIGEDGEFLPLLRLLGTPPIVPLPGGGRSPIQPIHADDLAALHVRAVESEDGWNRRYAVCGPHRYTLAELVRAVARGRRWIVPVPWALATWGAALLQWIVPFGPVTPDGLAMLRRGSACDPGPVCAAFGLSLRSIEPVLAGAAR